MTLLVDMAREAMLAKVGQRVKPLSRGYIERWIQGEFSLVDRVAKKHEMEIRAWKSVVLSVMETLGVDDLLAACKTARPDFTDLWESEGARRRLKEEWTKARGYVEGL